jgi:hypothetical protein
MIRATPSIFSMHRAQDAACPIRQHDPRALFAAETWPASRELRYTEEEGNKALIDARLKISSVENTYDLLNSLTAVAIRSASSVMALFASWTSMTEAWKSAPEISFN